MLEHVVLIKPKQDVDQSAVAALWSGIAGLKGRIPGIEAIALGDNVSPEGKDQGFTLGFVVTFADRAALDAYLPHPDHITVVPLVRTVAEDVIVFDVERT
jgi:hypothetical protein